MSNASFYILSARLTILIWTVLPAPYRYTGQVLLCSIRMSYRHAAALQNNCVLAGLVTGFQVFPPFGVNFGPESYPPDLFHAGLTPRDSLRSLDHVLRACLSTPQDA